MKAVSLIFRKLTDADFKNISGQGGVEGGGGQGYIDINTSGVSDDAMKKFLGKETEIAAQGPSWTFPVASLSFGAETQLLKIYKRRSSSFCIASQKIGTSASNRLTVWSSDRTDFPEKKYHEDKKPLVVYIIKDVEKKYWAGWFYRDEYETSWGINPDLARLFVEACGYVELNNVDFDVNIRSWPFLLKKNRKETPTHNNLTAKNFARNRIFFGAPGTGKSFTLNELSKSFEAQTKPHIDEAALIKAAVEDAKRKPGKLTLLNAIGFKYSSYLSGKSIKELQNITGYDKVGEFLVGAAAATIYPSIKIDEGRETDVDHVKEWLTDEKRGENDLLKWLNAVGFVFSDCVGSFQQNELQKTFGLSSYPQAYWLYQGAKVAKMDLSKEIDEEVRFVERVTFHPNYSYAQFVGTYKPVQDEDDSKDIIYSYVPGPFMRTYVRAKRAEHNKTDEKFLLIIEEINRANVAAVFGDVFQLLDRKKDGESEYPIAASEDIKRYLEENGINDCNELKIPSNMYIWATMNSADQGVFPMDTAFKRRWEFEYIGVNEGAGKLVDEQNQPIKIPIPYINNQKQIAYKSVKWNKLRVAINEKLLKEYRINEDKLMGPFFINLDVLKGANATEESKKSFVKSFKSKVLMYLYEDVAKMNPGKLFSSCGDHPLYSSVCEKFDEVGVEIFGFEKTTVDDMLKTE